MSIASSPIISKPLPPSPVDAGIQGYEVELPISYFDNPNPSLSYSIGQVPPSRLFLDQSHMDIISYSLWNCLLTDLLVGIPSTRFANQYPDVSRLASLNTPDHSLSGIYSEPHKRHHIQPRNAKLIRSVRQSEAPDPGLFIDIFNLAGNKRRSFSTQGGNLLNRMFGGSTSPTRSSKDGDVTPPSASTSKPNSGLGSIPDGLTLNSLDEGLDDDDERLKPSVGRNPTKDSSSPVSERKRRSSGIAKAGALLSSAKQSLHLSGTTSSNTQDNGRSPQPTAMQKLGANDPALSVPQGSLNNSAGESRPSPRSTFRVGVTEDKNKKCRRTMEDTHAYLYNFLSTPAPALGSDTESASSKSQISKASSVSDQSLNRGSQVVETDNGYFAIFDGHAGTFAADWCGKKLHVLLEDMIRKYPNTPVPELLDQTFTSVDQQLEKLPLKNSGCTAICAVLRWEDRIPNSQSATGSSAIAPATAAAVKAAAEPGNQKSSSDPSLASRTTAAGSASASTTNIPKLQESATRQRVLYTANVGDARIVLCRNGKALRLSYDHKGSDENEGKRILNAGGLILNSRVNGVLAVTRALGDAYMKELVTGHPYTTETVIQPDLDEFLILACDGVSLLLYGGLPS